MGKRLVGLKLVLKVHIRGHLKMIEDKGMGLLLGMVEGSMKENLRIIRLMVRENFLIQRVILVVFIHFRMEKF